MDFIGTKLSIRDICNSVLNSNCYEIRILEPTKTGKYEKFKNLIKSLEFLKSGLTKEILYSLTMTHPLNLVLINIPLKNT